MNRAVLYLFAVAATFLFSSGGQAQVNEICTRTSNAPSFGDSYGSNPYLYGKVILEGFDVSSKLPKVVIGMTERAQPEKRLILDKSGNYCFARTSAESAATLVVYVDGAEVSRKLVTSLGAAQQREDFEIFSERNQRQAPPGTVSAKYSYPPNPKTAELYMKALEAESVKENDRVLKYVKEIVGVDPADFVAWAKLGSLYFERKSYPDAQSAFRKSLELRPDYVPAMINLGKTYVVQTQGDPAIEILKKATEAEPTSASAFQILGRAYLLAKKGSLGVEALNKSIELDPLGMADSHLLMAVLYDRAGLKDLASHEYKLFLSKVSNHPDKAKFEKYIKENPE